MNRIYAHQSGGELWQGGKSDVEALLRGEISKVSVIGLFAQEFQPESSNRRYELVKLGYDDNRWCDDDELKKVGLIANRASDIFSDKLRQGKSCLSSCAA
jgi:hypothetical protein